MKSINGYVYGIHKLLVIELVIRIHREEIGIGHKAKRKEIK